MTQSGNSIETRVQRLIGRLTIDLFNLFSAELRGLAGLPEYTYPQIPEAAAPPKRVAPRVNGVALGMAAVTLSQDATSVFALYSRRKTLSLALVKTMMTWEGQRSYDALMELLAAGFITRLNIPKRVEYAPLQ